MTNAKTNAIAIAKGFMAIMFLVYKVSKGLAIGDEDIAIVTLAIGGALGNWFSADSRPEGAKTRQADNTAPPPDVKAP